MRTVTAMVLAAAAGVAISTPAAAQGKMTTYQLVMLKKGPKAADAQTQMEIEGSGT
jgi:hypothetical protein